LLSKIVTPDRVKEMGSDNGKSTQAPRTKEETKQLFSKMNKLTMMTAQMMSSKLDYGTLASQQLQQQNQSSSTPKSNSFDSGSDK
jgi:hypothetical protein